MTTLLTATAGDPDYEDVYVRVDGHGHTAASCTCMECVAACHVFPGWMTVEEAERAIDAGRGGDLMAVWFPTILWSNQRFQMADIVAEEGVMTIVLILLPAIRGCEGKVNAESDLHGVCTMLKAARCSIHDSGFKPIECRQALGCGGGGVPVDRDALMAAWRSDRGHAALLRWTEAHHTGTGP